MWVFKKGGSGIDDEQKFQSTDVNARWQSQDVTDTNYSFTKYL